MDLGRGKVITINSDSSDIADGIFLAVADARGVVTNRGTESGDSINLVSSTDDEVVFGQAGNDGIITGTGNDFIVSGSGRDISRGNNGNDTLDGGQGNDTLIGGSGDDFLSGDLAATDNSADKLNGGDGNDLLDGRAGNDTLSGDADDDTLRGGLGNDQMLGGTGNDVYEVDSTSDTVIELLGEGTDLVLSSVTYTLPSDVENLSLIGGNPINGTGNRLNNTITGNVAENVLDGRGGNDILNGGRGNDSLVGGAGKDTLNGASSGDGVGTIDSLTGSAGNDTFVLASDMTTYYNDGNNSASGSGDYALIIDFNSAQDRIQLEGTSENYLSDSLLISGVVSTAIYLDTNSDEILDSTDEVIGIVKDSTGLNLSASYFTYV